MNEIEVETDPREIVERVDDMLAWMRIGCESISESASSHVFWQDAYRRAEPLIAIGPREVGVMTPSGFRSDAMANNTLLFATDSVAENVQRVGAKMFASLGERPCFSSITESTSSPDVVYLNHGDNVEDLRSVGYGGMSYRLDGVCLLPPAQAAQVRRQLRFPSGARVLALQSHAIFRDGRAGSGVTFVAHDERAGWLIDDGVVAAKGVDAGGGFGQLAVAEVTRLLMRQYRRRSEWVVELAASPERTGVGLTTDGEGAAALIREIRGASSDPKRIVHWVSEHMRRRRGGGESLVRAHMRGKQAVRVGRYWATIYPSRVDIERACNGQRFDVAAKSAS